MQLSFVSAALILFIVIIGLIAVSCIFAVLRSRNTQRR